ncbi:MULTISPECIES: MFS transporter [Microbacterium]|uniref:MFS transporter n=1 Tax=Microbacterium wangchenii TaxID=2541726 RepID=A0ABX5SWX0_9MICO|nr:MULTISPECIES: MFS transporter [Microbacterium]MCK6065979.1 MFS transporter [Microbacterium sp. EYE_512]QBR90272.1 MFS transporter [Microbacterium wangchenii]TFV84918.1 MFS transporter [Microbacterium sp. dk485]TXK11713.1 MFS transporter [Microbacterium wangchenii]
MAESRPVPVAVRSFPAAALLLLSLGVFLTVTAEALPAGMLPEMAADLRVSPEQVGLLISVWAVTVIVTSIPLARVMAFVDRRLVVGGSLAVFALANVATAWAPDYGIALATRVAAAVAHGVFWAVVMVYATALLSPSHLGRGLAIVTAGGTAATVAGLPAGTVLAQLVGWRIAFAALGIAALVMAVLVVTRMPRLRPPRPDKEGSAGGFWRDPSLPAIAAFGIAAVLIALGQFATFTYVRPLLSFAGFDEGWAAALLFVYGTAGLIGVVVAGWLADRFPRGALAATLVVFAVALATLAAAMSTPAAVVVALVLWGSAIGAIFPLLQATLMRAATDRTRTLASAGIVVLFNVGIAIGPWLGGAVGGASAPQVTTALSAAVLAAAAVAGGAGVLLAGRPAPVRDRS